MSDRRQPRVWRQFVRALDNRFGQSTRKRIFRVAGISVVTLALLGNLAFLGVAAHEATVTPKPPPSPAVIAKRKALRKSLRAVAKKLAKAKAAKAAKAAAAKKAPPVKPLTPAQLAAALKAMQQAGLSGLGLANAPTTTTTSPKSPSAVTKPGTTPTPSSPQPSTTREQRRAKRQAASDGF